MKGVERLAVVHGRMKAAIWYRNIMAAIAAGPLPVLLSRIALTRWSSCDYGPLFPGPGTGR